MNRSELIELLTELALKDLSDGSDIYDHPCSVAIRAINQLPVVFEVGKYYKHSGGDGFLRIICKAKTTMWNDTLIAEEGGGSSGLRAVGKDETSAENWTECTEKEWMSNFS